MPSHDPAQFADELSAKLSTRSRHVGVFLGAGSSCACGVPDVQKLTELVSNGLTGDQRTAFEELRKERNLEQVLGRVRRIAALLDGVGGAVDGLDGKTAASLDKAICRQIVAELDLKDAELAPAIRFAAWAGRADYHLPVEIFTVNYDLVLETALEELNVPYFDGFVGALRAPFFTDLVDGQPVEPDAWVPAFFVRLWKLHGSVNWEWQGDSEGLVVRRGAAVKGESLAAIYPSDAKYSESRRMPFVVLQDRFRKSLQHPESVFLVSGYAFGDSHLNELLFDAARRRPRSETVVLCFGDIPEVAATNAALTPNVQVLGPKEAVIGGIRAEWAVPENPREEIWENDGFALGDFAKFSSFLAKTSPAARDLEARLVEALKLGADS